MPIRHAIWKVGRQPAPLAESTLVSERDLEDMIVAEPRILSDEWMLIGRQEDTGFGGRIDLLAIAPDASLILIELKRDRTPREVVAQALDYASWVEGLESEAIAAIYRRFTGGRNLADDFRARFAATLDEESLNDSHQIVILSSSLDASSERILSYLSDRGIGVNALCFQVFTNGDDQLLSRAWLLDPIKTQTVVASKADGPSEPWNGEFYVSFGHDWSRSWEDAVEFGFISAGGGLWYSRTLYQLEPGNRIWVKAPSFGYVGVGLVTGVPQPASEFKVGTTLGEVPVLDAAKRGDYHRQFVDDMERCEYFVPVHWLQTVTVERAVQEVGLFGNQNTVCKPTKPKWRARRSRG